MLPVDLQSPIRQNEESRWITEGGGVSVSLRFSVPFLISSPGCESEAL